MLKQTFTSLNVGGPWRRRETSPQIGDIGMGGEERRQMERRKGSKANATSGRERSCIYFIMCI